MTQQKPQRDRSPIQELAGTIAQPDEPVSLSKMAQAIADGAVDSVPSNVHPRREIWDAALRRSGIDPSTITEWSFPSGSGAKFSEGKGT